MITSQFLLEDQMTRKDEDSRCSRNTIPDPFARIIPPSIPDPNSAGNTAWAIYDHREILWLSELTLRYILRRGKPCGTY